ncbi:MAG TPA: InlB B-repeat-containing protein [Clostridiales bacterium]|nr:InlB B-repeat-containing protein [Clostridiales bacterium]
MKNKNKIRCIIAVIIVITASLLLSSCGISDEGVDPASWGYDCTVIYDALGGTVNSREIRETYYMNNSYLFKPAGTTNMLIEPVRDGYILAGWYTAKEDVKDQDGNVIGYSFRAEDRWDFDEDRVQGDMTLYARWIPQGKVQYVDIDTGEVVFTKNITADSPIQPLSGAAESLIAKSGYTFYGYFADDAGTIPYDFTTYVHQDLIPSNEEVYALLYEKFPQYFSRVEYVEPPEDEEIPLEEDTSHLFFNKLGYELTTDDPAALEEIRKYKDTIYEDAINYYQENTANSIVYLKYEAGSYVRVTSPDDIKQGGKYSFSGTDKAGNPIEGYVISNDIDFTGIVLETAEEYSGQIIGNGFTLKNITVRVNSRKIDTDKSKTIGLFQSLNGAYIEDLNFENMTVTMNINSGIPVTVGALAAEGRNTQLKNVHFTNLTIDTGQGDDGAASYKVGDLFASQSGNKLDNVAGTNVNINASEFAQVELVLEQQENETQPGETDEQN